MPNGQHPSAALEHGGGSSIVARLLAQPLQGHEGGARQDRSHLKDSLYPYFDARRWRILKAKDDAGDFVTTDHPVCVYRPGGGINYGQQFAPGFGLSDRDILFPLSSKVALIGRLEGEEGVVEVDRHSVASFNATVMGYAMKQIYSADDQYYYTRPAPQALSRGSTLLQDPNLKVRED